MIGREWTGEALARRVAGHRPVLGGAAGPPSAKAWAVREVLQDEPLGLLVAKAVISGGSIDRIAEKAADFELKLVLPQDDDALFDAYRIHGFPGIVEIHPEGAISSPVALGPAGVREVLLGSSAGQRSVEPTKSAIG